jgi:hypothetical protein
LSNAVVYLMRRSTVATAVVVVAAPAELLRYRRSAEERDGRAPLFADKESGGNGEPRSSRLPSGFGDKPR